MTAGLVLSAILVWLWSLLAYLFRDRAARYFAHSWTRTVDDEDALDFAARMLRFNVAFGILFGVVILMLPLLFD